MKKDEIWVTGSEKYSTIAEKSWSKVTSLDQLVHGKGNDGDKLRKFMMKVNE